MGEVTKIAVRTAGGQLVEVATTTALVQAVGEAQASPPADTLNGRLKALREAQPAALGPQAKAGSLSIALASDHDKLAVDQVSAGYDVANSTARPANTVAYAAGDVVGGPLTFANIGPTAGGSILISNSQLEIDIAAIPSGMSIFKLYLYSVTPPSALADNAVFDLPVGDRASFLGVIELGAPADLGSTLYVERNDVNKQVKLASGNLYGYLVTTAAYTPGSGDVSKVTLHSVAV